MRISPRIRLFIFFVALLSCPLARPQAIGSYALFPLRGYSNFFPELQPVAEQQLSAGWMQVETQSRGIGIRRDGELEGRDDALFEFFLRSDRLKDSRLRLVLHSFVPAAAGSTWDRNVMGFASTEAVLTSADISPGIEWFSDSGRHAMRVSLNVWSDALGYKSTKLSRSVFAKSIVGRYSEQDWKPGIGFSLAGAHSLHSPDKDQHAGVLTLRWFVQSGKTSTSNGELDLILGRRLGLGGLASAEADLELPWVFASQLDYSITTKWSIGTLFSASFWGKTQDHLTMKFGRLDAPLLPAIDILPDLTVNLQPRNVYYSELFTQYQAGLSSVRFGVGYQRPPWNETVESIVLGGEGAHLFAEWQKQVSDDIAVILGARATFYRNNKVERQRFVGLYDLLNPISIAQEIGVQQYTLYFGIKWF